MKVGILLLDKNDNYLINGKLPKRPGYDKALLTALATQQARTVKAAELLPPSILNVGNQFGDTGLLIGIREISQTAHLLIVVRGEDSNEVGNKFRFEGFNKMVSTKELELWVRDYD